MGMRPIRGRKLLLEGEDAATIKDGRNRLVRWGLFKITRKDDKLTEGTCGRRHVDVQEEEGYPLAGRVARPGRDGHRRGPVRPPQYGDVCLVRWSRTILVGQEQIAKKVMNSTPWCDDAMSKVETAAWADPMLKLISQGRAAVACASRRRHPTHRRFAHRRRSNSAGFYRVDVRSGRRSATTGRRRHCLVYVPDGKPGPRFRFPRPAAKPGWAGTFRPRALLRCRVTGSVFRH